MHCLDINGPANSDYNKRLILLSAFQLSGRHCTFKTPLLNEIINEINYVAKIIRTYLKAPLQLLFSTSRFWISLWKFLFSFFFKPPGNKLFLAQTWRTKIEESFNWKMKKKKLPLGSVHKWRHGLRREGVSRALLQQY